MMTAIRKPGTLPIRSVKSAIVSFKEGHGDKSHKWHSDGSDQKSKDGEKVFILGILAKRQGKYDISSAE